MYWFTIPNIGSLLKGLSQVISCNFNALYYENASIYVIASVKRFWHDFMSILGGSNMRPLLSIKNSRSMNGCKANKCNVIYEFWQLDFWFILVKDNSNQSTGKSAIMMRRWCHLSSKSITSVNIEILMQLAWIILLYVDLL